MEFWKKYGYEITIAISLLIIFFNWLLRLGKKGTWATRIYFPEDYKNYTQNTRRIYQPKPDSKGEMECRRVLEKLFGKPFNKYRPDFLKNPILTNYNLELDCYNPELRLAVEYNGAQHYKYIPYFHKTHDSFRNQQYRDYIKKDLCEKNGIVLIEVPYTVQIPMIKTFLLNKLYRAGYNKWMI